MADLVLLLPGALRQRSNLKSAAAMFAGWI